MSSTAKKSIIFWVVLLGISIACLIGKFIVSSIPKTPVVSVNEGANSGTIIEIDSATMLKSIIENYDATKQNENFVLTADIDMNDLDDSERVVDRTIGTGDLPFRGTFDGKGYVISNLSIDLSDSRNDADDKYIGLFGYTDGATIKNLAISGTSTFKVGDCVNVYAGCVVGCAKNTTINYVQNTANIAFDDDIFVHNVKLGGFAGQLSGCNKVKYIISRANSIDNITLANVNTSSTYNIGGFVGNLLSSAVRFSVVKSAFDIDISSEFRGTANVGGFAGVISNNSTQILNGLIENNFNIDDTAQNVNATLKVGEVGGEISSFVPAAGGVAYIYYKTSSTYPPFGNTRKDEQGRYIAETDTGYNFSENCIMAISRLPENQEEIAQTTWYNDLGEWNFDSVWYFNTKTLYLQCCYGDYTINLGTNLRSGKVVEIKDSAVVTKYRYGDNAQITFGFVDVEEGEDVIKMSDYYTMTGLTKGGDVATSIEYVDGVYSITSTTRYALDTKANGDFVLTIKNMNMSTNGTFDISYSANKFSIRVTSKLFNSEGEFEADYPAYVFQPSGTKENDILPLDAQYDQSFTLNTTLKNTHSPYSPLGWFIEKEGEDELITSSTSLSIVFGHGKYKGNMNIYAKYENDACMLTFLMDAGIKEVMTGTEVIAKKSNDQYAISKRNANFKIEVYINENYTFDVEDFIKTLDTYKSSDTTSKFCVWNNEDSDGSYYSFTLNMTTLKEENIVNGLNIDLKTTKVKASQNGMVVWYVVGGAGGALLLAGVIVLIVVLKRRNSFGGGSHGGSSFNKKNYKDMYY